MITSSVFYFIVDKPSSGKYNCIHQMTHKRPTCSYVPFIDRTAQIQSIDYFTVILGYELYSLLQILL